jgi:exonuclease III
MTLISWNCRGLGSPRAVRDLCQLAKENKARILFLMETKCSKARVEMVRIKLGFTGAFTVDPVGRSGGLTLLWKEEKEVEIQNFSRRHINAIITEEGVQSWKLTGFYGHPEWAKRHEAWDLLFHLKSYIPDPWLVIGDFNEILEQSEKEGGAQRREAQMDLFRNTLENCQLSDLGFIGP